jgi:hypothetical protein
VVELSPDVWLTDPINFLNWEGVFDTNYIAASGQGSVGFISYALGDPNDETLQFAGLDFDKTQAEWEADEVWGARWLVDDAWLQVNTGVENRHVFPRGVSFVGMSPTTLNFTWNDGFIITLDVTDFTTYYVADATELALNNPTYYEWMIKPDWIP